MMKNKIINILTTAIASGIMVYLSIITIDKFQLFIPWATFIGCSTYFLSLQIFQDKNIIKSILSNLIGLMIGYCCIVFGGKTLLSNSIVTGIFSGLIVFIGQSKFLSNAALIFLGGAVMFGLSNDSMDLDLISGSLSLILGNIIGATTVYVGKKLNG